MSDSLSNPIEQFFVKFKSYKLVGASVAGFALVALVHVPLGSFTTLFDKNQAPELIAMLLVACGYGLVILNRAKNIPHSKPALILAGLLILSLILSALHSSAFFPSITGDSLRYAGIASNIALLLIALFHGLFTSHDFPKLIAGYLGVIFVAEVLAILQFLKVIALPGLQGNPTSTFGNLDFFSAFIGTAFPLILYVWLGSARLGKTAAVSLAALSVVCLRLADAKQGYLDLLISVVVTLLAIIYRKSGKTRREPRYSLNVRTIIGAIAVFIWLEFIFIFPFIGKAIPIIGSDPQVAIRGVMWLAGVNQFKSHPVLGVGPDQYGAYYEHYRTVNSTIVLPGDSSNDAHSATVQTLATTGIVGSLIFFLLMVLVVRSILIIIEREPFDRKRIYALALFLFIYITNAAVSPIILPHKYLLWAVCGFLVFQASRLSERPANSISLTRILRSTVALFTVIVLFVGISFSTSQINFARWGESLKNDAKAKPKVEISQFLPCHIYFTYLAGYLSSQGDAAIEKLSRDQVAINPRCYEAQRMLAALAYNKGDLKELRKQVYILIDLAPAQREVLDIANLYAVKAGDKNLEAKVKAQLANMGVYTLQVG